MAPDNIAQQALQNLTNFGADKGVVKLNTGEQKELNIDGGRITLLRSTFNTSLQLAAFEKGKKGTTSINKTGTEELAGAAKRALELARSSDSDPANEIAEKQEPAEFQTGVERPDLNLMYDRLTEFLEYVTKSLPDTILEQCALNFISGKSQILNTNQVDFTTRYGHYGFSALFSTRKENRSSSFNSVGFQSNHLDQSLHAFATVDTLLRQNAEQIDTKPVDGKFTGDIIVTPDCLMNLLSFVIQHISDFSLITGSSVYKDQLNNRIASDKLNLHSAPLKEDMVTGYFVTGDGYRAENSTIIDRGVLRTFLLSLYGSRKTGLSRSVNDGGCFVIDPGESSFQDMIRNTSRGILLCRLSGGSPSNNGDFSGVAKNSYYIKDGFLQQPLSETMISGNIVELLKNVEEISAEQINFGSSLLPWVRFSGITVSGS